MVCHICGEPASAQCSDCQRYICGIHTGFGRQCTECQKGLARRVEWKEQKRKEVNLEMREKTKCAFCGDTPEYVHYDVTYDNGHPVVKRESHYLRVKCAICSRYFCGSHGNIEYNDMGRWDGGYAVKECWFRCQDHRRVTLGIWGFLRKADPPDEIVRKYPD